MFLKFAIWPDKRTQGFYNDSKTMKFTTQDAKISEYAFLENV